MKPNQTLAMLLMGMALCSGIQAQSLDATDLSRNNEEGVVKVNPRERAYRENQILVKFREGSPVQMRRAGKRMAATVSAVDALFAELGVESVEQLMPQTGGVMRSPSRRMKTINGEEMPEPDMSTLYLLELPAKTSVNYACAKFAALTDEVEFAEPNYIAEAMSSEGNYNDPLYSEQWGIPAINLDQLWLSPVANSARPIIAILDTGVDISHPDLADNIWTNPLEGTGADGEDDDDNILIDDIHGWDFITQSATISDNNGHGTHVAGIAAAVGNNGLGVVGANPDALIMPLKVLNDGGTGDMATIIKGIDYAVNKGAHIINMSFGFKNVDSQILKQALDKAFANYVVLVAAAGNHNWEIHFQDPITKEVCVVYPAAYENVIGVAASDIYGNRAGFSNWDHDDAFSRYGYEVTAPGVNIISTYPGGAYKKLSGTSMATPMIAGAISRVLQVKGFDAAKEYAFMGDVRLSKVESSDIFNAYALSLYNENNREIMLGVQATIEGEDEDGDNVIDAGEIVQVYPVISSSRGHATDVVFSISAIEPEEVDIPDGSMEETLNKPKDNTLPSSYYDILIDQVDFGWSVNTSGVMKGKNPFKIKIHEDAINGKYITLRITASCNGKEFSTKVSFPISNISELKGVIAEDLTLPAKVIEARDCAIRPGVTVHVPDGCILDGDIENYGTIIVDKGGKIGSGISPSPYTNGISNIVIGHGNIIVKSGGTIERGRNESIWGYDLLGHYYGYDNWTYDESVANPHPQLCDFGGIDENIQLQGGAIVLSPYIEDNEYLTISYSAFQSTKDNPVIIYGNIHISGLYAISPYFSCYGDVLFDNSSQTMPDEGYGWSAMEATETHYKLEGIKISGKATFLPAFYSWYCERNTDEWQKEVYCDVDIEASSYEFDLRPITYMLNSSKKDIYQQPSYVFRWGETYIDLIKYRFKNMDIHFESTYADIPNNGEGEGDMSSFTFEDCNLSGNISYGEAIRCNIPGWLWSLEDKEQKNNHPGVLNSMSLRYGVLQTPPAEHEVPYYIGSSSLDYINKYLVERSKWWPDVNFTSFAEDADHPYFETPGMVWTVSVDGYDAQDEFDEMPPIGVGRHKVDVKFNRPMDKMVAPTIAMGLSEPYTQIAINENGKWNSKGDIYTAYITIGGKTGTDGINKITVKDAVDQEGHTIIPVNHWNVNVQVAGALSTGLIAEAGVGKVILEWETDEADFTDLMGYNVYRFVENSKDTIRINTSLIEATATEYIDYDIVPGTTYYYLVREMGTDFQEFDVSNIVAATPLTASKGDANGSMSVDVADVVTEIAYLTNQNPQPFIFEAADVNEDQSVDILDVVGTLNIIITPSDAAIAGINEEPAVYSVEDGILYVETPVTLGGIQAIVNIEREGAEISTLDDLKGFEQTSAWLNDNQYVFLAYSMSGKTMAPGKHALLRVGNTANVNLVLSDAKGKNVETVNANSTRLTGVCRDAQEGCKVIVTDLTGRVVSAKNLSKGFYLFSTYSADGQLIQTEKVVLE